MKEFYHVLMLLLYLTMTEHVLLHYLLTPATASIKEHFTNSEYIHSLKCKIQNE